MTLLWYILVGLCDPALRNEEVGIVMNPVVPAAWRDYTIIIMKNIERQ